MRRNLLGVGRLEYLQSHPDFVEGRASDENVHVAFDGRFVFQNAVRRDADAVQAGPQSAQPLNGRGALQAAGPLEVVIPQDGIYTIAWDGDPFNVMRVEALCMAPPTPTGETP